MPLGAIFLLLAGAGLHALWNFWLKQAQEKYLVSWVAMLFSAAFLPVVPSIWEWPQSRIWPYLVSSAFVEALYLAILASAYRLSDFSLIYPLGRGAAPCFLALWARLFLGERFSPFGWVGLTLTVAGLLLVGSSGLRSRDGKRPSWLGVGLGLSVALLVATYSAIDGAAVKQTAPTPYTILVLSLTGLFFTPYALWGEGWHKTWKVTKKEWRRALAVGLASLVAYALALNAYSHSLVGYAGAVREVSVVFAAFLGWKVLGEPLGRQRLLGAAVIFLGIVLMALA